jgi:hypothetical protein
MAFTHTESISHLLSILLMDTRKLNTNRLFFIPLNIAAISFKTIYSSRIHSPVDSAGVTMKRRLYLPKKGTPGVQ